ncbi:hypothetical protein [Pseudomonas frederiksbergensis]|uniref:hypothetical protein n=1 Tax=Pseudomonas frederiksbergensis TaxID=104087 RepID=UPI0011B05B26|nr:hypothetical protein [Pseudomonas frederiksbergensis]
MAAIHSLEIVLRPAKKYQDISPRFTEDAPHGSRQGERKMGLFMQFWAWLFKDKRSAWEQKKDRLAIDAFNKLKNYSVSDRGGLSMDPEELREQVVTDRKELKHLVQPSPNRATHAHQSTTAPLTARQGHAAQCTSRVDDFVEVVTWRRLNSSASARYVCLESLTTKQYAVATADLFSEPLDSLLGSLAAKVNQRVASVITAGELKWFDTASEAMDAYDASL